MTNWTLQDAGVDLQLEAEPDDIYAWDPTTDELELNETALSGLPGAFTLAAPTFTVKPPAAGATSPRAIVAVQQVVAATDAEVQYITGDQPLWQAAQRGGFTVTFPVEGAFTVRVRSRADVQLSAWVQASYSAAPGT